MQYSTVFNELSCAILGRNTFSLACVSHQKKRQEKGVKKLLLELLKGILYSSIQPADLLLPPGRPGLQ